MGGVTLNLVKLEGVGDEIITMAACSIMITIIFSLVFFAWETSCRRALEFDMYIVEMYTMQKRRLVEVLYMGSNYNRELTYNHLLEILRRRALQEYTDDGSLLRVSETNVVIQAPSNIVDSAAQSSLINGRHNQLILWDIEMPPSLLQNSSSRDSQIAAAAALTVLGKARTDYSSRQKDVRASSNGRDRPSQTSVVQMQYLQPINRRGLGSLQSYRTPVALSLSREAIAAPTGPRRNESARPEANNARSTNLETNTVQDDPAGINTEIENSIGNTSSLSQETVQVRLKFLDDSQRIVQAELSATVLQFKSTTFPTDMRNGRIIRLIFRGKLMRDDTQTLATYGLHNDCIVHCHISDTPYQQPQGQNMSTNSTTFAQGNNITSNQMTTEAENTNVWLLRIFLSFLTTQIVSFPIQIRSYLLEFVLNREELLRPSERNTFISNVYRRFHGYLLAPLFRNNYSVEDAAAAASNPRRPLCIGNFLLWIFGGQCVIVWSFVYYFPQLCDRTALGLLLLLTLYFFFVVIPMPYRLHRRSVQ